MIEQKQEVELTGMLGEFRSALKDEIEKIEKSGQSSTILKNGRRIESSSGDYWYRFDVDYIPVIPADTPCNLIVGKVQYNITVIGFDESEVTIASSVGLPDTIASARLENGATVLMERLIKRIEEKADAENIAGYRMIPKESEMMGFTCIFPDADVQSDPKMNDKQNEAVESALRNDITYIWGPPGTGKTTVIGSIIRRLYDADRSVLIVSHTNTAVDGAIEKVQNLREDNGECPVLRIGIPQKKLAPEVELQYHIRKLGEGLFSRQEELQVLRTEKNIRINAINDILEKIGWVKDNRIAQIEDQERLILIITDERNRAYTDYQNASEQLKSLKLANPGLKTLSQLQEKEKVINAQYDELNSQIQSARKKIQDCSEQIKVAEEESSKHHVYVTLKAEHDELMPASFVEQKATEQNHIVASLTAEKDELETQKHTNEAIVAQGNKGSLSAFFSRKSIQQAEAKILSINAELQTLHSRLDVARAIATDYEQQLIKIHSLEQRMEDVVPSRTEEYWIDIRSEAERGLELERNRESIIIHQMDELQFELESLREKIDALNPVKAEMFRLVSVSSEKKKRYRDSEEKLNSQIAWYKELIDGEKRVCSSFCTLDTEYSQGDIVIVLKQLLKEIEIGVKDENEEELHNQEVNIRAELVDINNELSDIAEKVKNLEHQAITQAKIVGATLAKTYLSDTLQEAKFDTLILDEASMASIPALWCASYIAEKNIIIVGDFLQLPPILMADTPMAKKWLGRDIFAVSGMQEAAKLKKSKPGNFIMLNDQFRMEKEIADIANLYYGEYVGLKSDDMNPRRVEERNKFYEWFNGNRENSVELVDTSNLHAWVTTIPQGRSHSRLNCFSAALDVEMAFNWLHEDVQKMMESGKPSESPKVLIVAPYKPHVERVKHLVNAEYKYRGLPEDANLIKAGTIHSFQGNEADIVIFDLVVDEPHWKTNLFMPGDEINRQMDKLFNVAVTRAKFKLFIVGNVKFCQQRAKNNSLSKLLDYLIEDKQFPIVDAKNAYPNLLVSRPMAYEIEELKDTRHVICREGAFYDFFLNDVKNLKQRMIIYSPFMTENRISKIIPYFKDAITTGKRIAIVTKPLEDRKRTELAQYKKIENELKCIGIDIIHKKGMHEKLIFVDDCAVWMGSLNALSYTGETGEIMHRHFDREMTYEYEKIFGIKYLNSALEKRKELLCPICGGEMQLREGESGVYWKCRNEDYNRSVDQQYPDDGILRCSCGGEYTFSMKNEPRWVCINNPKHFQKMRYGDLKLEKMAVKIPTKKIRKEVDQYFLEHKKGDTGKEPSEIEEIQKATIDELNCNMDKNEKNQDSRKHKGKTMENEATQLSFFDL